MRPQGGGGDAPTRTVQMPPTPPAMKAFEPPADLTSSSLNSFAPSTIVSLSSAALCLSSAALGGVVVVVMLLLLLLSVVGVADEG